MLLDAIFENNPAKLDELLHDDLLLVIPGGQVITKVQSLKVIGSNCAPAS